MAYTAAMSSGRASRTCTLTASAGISRLLAVEDALERFEMRAGVPGRVGGDDAAGFAHDFGPYLAQRQPGRAGEHLQAAGALEVVKRVERFGHGGSHDDDAVAREEKDAPVAQHAR